MYDLKDKTKEMATFTVGIEMNKFLEFDYDEELMYVNHKNGANCIFLPEEDDRIIGRGNPFLARNEFLTMEEENKELYKNN